MESTGTVLSRRPSPRFSALNMQKVVIYFADYYKKSLLILFRSYIMQYEVM